MNIHLEYQSGITTLNIKEEYPSRISIWYNNLENYSLIISYVIICKAPLAGSYSEVLSEWQACQKKCSNSTEMLVIMLEESCPGLQECLSRVRDPLQQKPGAGIEKYPIREQEAQIDKLSEVGERSKQRVRRGAINLATAFRTDCTKASWAFGSPIRSELQ